MKSLKLAWFLYGRDERLSGGLMLLILSLSFGVGAIVSLDIFARRISATMQRDSKALLAADYQVQSWRPFTDKIWQGFSDEKSHGNLIEQRDFVSSLNFGTGSANTDAGSALTVSVRALEGKNYPFYGKFETEPQISIEDLREKPSIVLDSSFRSRGVKIGDQVRLGTLQFSVVSFLTQEPQSLASAFALGPRVMIHQVWADKTGLTGRGARVFNQLLIRSSLSSKDFTKKLRSFAPEPHWRLITPEHANKQADRIVSRIRGFLSFVGLTGLFLGGVGLFMIFRSQFLLKLAQFLTLRCLGASRKALIYLALIRASVVALVGSLLGCVLGVQLEHLITSFARSQMDVNLTDLALWPSFVFGAVVAFIVGITAAALPLMGILRVPVSSAMRQDETQNTNLDRRDALILFVLSLILTLIVNRNYKLSLIFLASLVGCTVLLAILSGVIGVLLRPLLRVKSFVIRHSLLGLFRKVGRSQLLLISLGLGLFLLESVIWVGICLRQQLNIANRDGVPNIYFLNVGQNDLPILKNLLPDLKTDSITQARLTEIERKPIAVATEDEEGRERFFETREYFVTRRNTLNPGERLVKSDQIFGPKPQGDEIRASIEQGFADVVNLTVGKTFKIDIAGVTLTARVDSIRTVDWFDFQPNFFIVLNADDLADAPMDYVAFTRVDKSHMQDIQNKVGKSLPQISVLDGDALGRRLGDLLSKLSFSVFSLSLFSLGSCLFVFIGMTLARIREYKKDIALWKCLGLAASKVRTLFVIESLVLASAACVAALLASTIAVVAICHYFLDIAVEYPGHLFIVSSLIVVPILFGFLVTLLSARFVQMNSAMIWRELDS